MTQYEMNMVILLPDPSKNDGEALAKLEKSLKADTLDIMRRDWQMPRTRVYLPKFSFTGVCSVAKDLNNLGLKSVFSDKSGANITDCIHAASIGKSNLAQICTERNWGNFLQVFRSSLDQLFHHVSHSQVSARC